MPDDTEFNKVLGILGRNHTKNFVDRIINKDKYPILNNPDGSYSTHSMAWGETDGKNIVYPTVVYDNKSKSLRRLKDREAMEYAIKNNEYIEFPDPVQADWFSRRYKVIWGK